MCTTQFTTCTYFRWSSGTSLFQKLNDKVCVWRRWDTYVCSGLAIIIAGGTYFIYSLLWLKNIYRKDNLTTINMPLQSFITWYSTVIVYLVTVGFSILNSCPAEFDNSNTKRLSRIWQFECQKSRKPKTYPLLSISFSVWQNLANPIQKEWET